MTVSATKLTSKEINSSVRQIIIAYRHSQVGRDDAFRKIVPLVQRRVITVLRYVFGVISTQDQDDLFQEVMLRFVRSEPFYDIEQPILPWLYTIARNVKYDFMVDRNKRAECQVEEPTAKGKWTDVNRVHLKIALKLALEQLSEGDRELLWLKYYDGYTDQEIAARLKKPYSRTKYYILAAKQKLCNLLRGNRPPGDPPPTDSMDGSVEGRAAPPSLGTFFVALKGFGVGSSFLVKGVMTIMRCTDTELRALFNALGNSEETEISAEREDQALTRFQDSLREKKDVAAAASGKHEKSGHGIVFIVMAAAGAIFLRQLANLFHPKVIVHASAALASIGLVVPVAHIVQRSIVGISGPALTYIGEASSVIRRKNCRNVSERNVRRIWGAPSRALSFVPVNSPLVFDPDWQYGSRATDASGTMGADLGESWADLESDIRTMLIDTSRTHWISADGVVNSGSRLSLSGGLYRRGSRTFSSNREVTFAFTSDGNGIAAAVGATPVHIDKERCNAMVRLTGAAAPAVATPVHVSSNDVWADRPEYVSLASLDASDAYFSAAAAAPTIFTVTGGGSMVGANGTPPVNVWSNSGSMVAVPATFALTDCNGMAVPATFTVTGGGGMVTAAGTSQVYILSNSGSTSAVPVTLTVTDSGGMVTAAGTPPVPVWSNGGSTGTVFTVTGSGCMVTAAETSPVYICSNGGSTSAVTVTSIFTGGGGMVTTATATPGYDSAVSALALMAGGAQYDLQALMLLHELAHTHGVNGNNAWAILALVAAAEHFGDSSYIEKAYSIANPMHTQLLDKTGRGFRGYFSYPGGGGKSTEHNSAIFGAFEALSNAFGKRGQTAEATEWNRRAKIAGDFVIAMYDQTGGRFYAGTVPDSVLPTSSTEMAAVAREKVEQPCGQWPNIVPYGKDVINTSDFNDAQTASTIMLAESPLYRNVIDWRRPIEHVTARFRKVVAIGDQRFEGFSVGPSDFIQWEQTAKAAVAMQMVGAIYREERFESMAKFYLSEIRKAQRVAPFADGKGIVGATRGNLVSVDGANPPACVSQRSDLGATVWGVLADLGTTPLRLATGRKFAAVSSQLN